MKSQTPVSGSGIPMIFLRAAFYLSLTVALGVLVPVVECNRCRNSRFILSFPAKGGAWNCILAMGATRAAE